MPVAVHRDGDLVAPDRHAGRPRPAPDRPDDPGPMPSTSAWTPPRPSPPPGGWSAGCRRSAGTRGSRPRDRSPRRVRADLERGGLPGADPRRRGSRGRPRDAAPDRRGDAPRGERPSRTAMRRHVRASGHRPPSGPLADRRAISQTAPDGATIASRRRRAPACRSMCWARATRSSGRRRDGTGAFHLRLRRGRGSCSGTPRASGSTNRPRGWLARLHPEDRDRVVEAWTKAAEGDRLDVEYRFATKGGGEAWLWHIGQLVPATVRPTTTTARA